MLLLVVVCTLGAVKSSPLGDRAGKHREGAGCPGPVLVQDEKTGPGARGRQAGRHSENTLARRAGNRASGRRCAQALDPGRSLEGAKAPERKGCWQLRAEGAQWGGLRGPCLPGECGLTAREHRALQTSLPLPQG